MGDEGEGDAPAGAPAAPETTTPAADTTTAGAQMMLNTPWLTAAAVAFYATKAMWVKFREIGLAKQKKRHQKLRADQPDNKADHLDGLETVAEAEAEDESEDEPDANFTPKHLSSQGLDVVKNNRIEILPVKL
ncbi:uncharacterized protein Dana_GF13413 [Drosophila ananassae]|uniref:Uncharacterized protein n=1 Tax=Drosophila ananassae TaxID=7217 RepID=B3MCX3_DROAN|nr:uncharacterized protein LOC6496255 [Drosophila ananassae]EDV37375.2 uncharacterized protein Dana_GF13413 [Drosophila ananassae]